MHGFWLAACGLIAALGTVASLRAVEFVGWFGVTLCLALWTVRDLRRHR